MKRRHPRCECGELMTRAAARIRREGDERTKDRLPYRGIGWYCDNCVAVQLGDWLVQSGA